MLLLGRESRRTGKPGSECPNNSSAPCAQRQLLLLPVPTTAGDSQGVTRRRRADGALRSPGVTAALADADSSSRCSNGASWGCQSIGLQADPSAQRPLLSRVTPLDT
jgi:hypothetical protein